MASFNSSNSSRIRPGNSSRIASGQSRAKGTKNNNGNEIKIYPSNNKANSNTDTFTSTTPKTSPVNPAITNTKSGNINNTDDGKISNMEKLTAMGKGVYNTLDSALDTAREHPLQTAAVVGGAVLAGAATTAASPIIAGAGAATLGGMALYSGYQGLKQMYNGYNTAKNAKTDAEAKQGYENIGGGGLITGLSALGGTSAAKSVLGKGISSEAAAAGDIKSLGTPTGNGNSLSGALKDTPESSTGASTSISESLKNMFGGIKKAKEPTNQEPKFQTIDAKDPSPETSSETISPIPDWSVLENPKVPWMKTKQGNIFLKANKVLQSYNNYRILDKHMTPNSQSPDSTTKA